MSRGARAVARLLAGAPAHTVDLDDLDADWRPLAEVLLDAPDRGAALAQRPDGQQRWAELLAADALAPESDQAEHASYTPRLEDGGMSGTHEDSGRGLRVGSVVGLRLSGAAELVGLGRRGHQVGRRDTQDLSELGHRREAGGAARLEALHRADGHREPFGQSRLCQSPLRTPVAQRWRGDQGRAGSHGPAGDGTGQSCGVCGSHGHTLQSTPRKYSVTTALRSIMGATEDTRMGRYRGQ